MNAAAGAAGRPGDLSRHLPTIAVILAAAAAAATQVRANDLWWHLKAGEWIVSHLAVPRSDPFTFTSGGAPWVDHGWLWQIVAWSLHSAGGVQALAVLKIGGAALVAFLAMRALLASRFDPHAASLFVLVCIAGARFRFLDRPDTISLACLAGFLAVLLAPSTPLVRRVVAAGSICVLWANLHAGVLFAPVAAASFALGSAIAGITPPAASRRAGVRMLRRSRDEGLVALAAAAAILVNPYGIGLLRVPLTLKEALGDPRLVNPEWLPPTIRTFPLFHAALAAILALAAVGIVRRGKAELWRTLIPAAAAGGLAMTSARHLGIFYAILPFAAAAGRTSRGVVETDRPGNTRRGATAALWGIAAAVLFVAVPPAASSRAGFAVEPGRFPEREADYVETNLPAPRKMYNDVAHGGYLIWRFYPGDLAFIDGRNEVHAPLLHEIASSLDSGLAWESLLERHGIRSALVRYREESIQVAGAGKPVYRSFSALHFPRERWALVFWGDSGMVFLCRGAEFDAIIARDEYRYIQPEEWEDQLRRCRAGDDELKAGILADLERRSEGPPSRRAEEISRRFGNRGRRAADESP